jgi:molecular chaperone Hsp33
MSDQISVEEFTRAESLFVRHRNVLAIRAQLAPVYTDYYLHLMQHRLRHDPALDAMLKDLIAALLLHAAARPWAETIAWTVNLRAPRVNLFATASSLEKQIAGRLFTEGVREPDRNLFYSQTTTKPGEEPRLSAVQVDGDDPLFWLGQYYTQSEQRPAKALRLEDETFMLFAAQPDFDDEWFARLDPEIAANLEEEEETKLLETRRFKFECGCDLRKILPVLGGWREKPDELFGDRSEIIVQCPRCAARYPVTREML